MCSNPHPSLSNTLTPTLLFAKSQHTRTKPKYLVLAYADAATVILLRVHNLYPANASPISIHTLASFQTERPDTVTYFHVLSADAVIVPVYSTVGDTNILNLPFNSERMLQDDTIKSKKGASKDERTID